MIKNITKFSEMIILNNSLYVFDIDETFMVFKNITDKWWAKKINEYLKYYGDNKKAQLKMNELFYKIITKEHPKPTDLKGFKNLETVSNKINNDIIFLTARSEQYKELTLKHLNYVYPNINHDVYFSKKKGLKLKEIIENSKKKYDKIIFVDDKQYNIDNVLQILPNTLCYKFNYMEYIYNFENL